MSWRENIDALSEALVDASCFGEPVQLPSGAIVYGIFERVGPMLAPTWPETGLATRISREANPSVVLRAADAIGLAAGDLLTIDQLLYRISAPLRPDGESLVYLELTPHRASADGSARWQ